MTYVAIFKNVMRTLVLMLQWNDEYIFKSLTFTMTLP